MVGKTVFFSSTQLWVLTAIYRIISSQLEFCVDFGMSCVLQIMDSNTIDLIIILSTHLSCLRLIA